METIIQAAISNVILASGLALIAWVVSRFLKLPHLSYLLWLLVLVKLVTPPILSIPCIDLPKVAQSTAPLSVGEIADSEVIASDALTTHPSVWYQNVNWQNGLLTVLLLGSGVALIWSLFRAASFHRAVIKSTRPAPAEVDAMARVLAHHIGLKKLPELHIISANTSPMEWWMGGPVHVIFPEYVLEDMKPHQWRWILAHELTHVRRRDHIVRWLEWFSGVLFWWNPIMWWARKELRAQEELCCDSQVLEAMNATSSSQSNSKNYANAILSILEKLVSPELHPPVMASQMNSGGQLEKRMTMILNQNKTHKTSRILRAGVILSAAVALPLGLTYAEDTDATKKSEKAEKIEKSEYTAKAKAWYDGAKKKIDAEVKAGTMTQEDTDKKLASIREVLAKKAKSGKEFDKKGVDKKPSLKEIKLQLAAAVKAGRVTQEESDEKLKYYINHLKKSAKGKGVKGKSYSIDDVKKKSAAAVKAGKMTQEDADAKIEAYMKDLKKEK